MPVQAQASTPSLPLLPLPLPPRQGVERNLEEWIELSNGCMCCSVKNSFVQALEGLMSRKDKFEYILIETTGVGGEGGGGTVCRSVTTPSPPGVADKAQTL